ncbi:MAG: branched-chain amino acid transaminase, partial [Anaerolineaceae bacterium]|nr:branched-chain amino acid transaminase [Anaerolineaceae bacterium]
MSTRSEFVWMDGELVPYDQATVPFLNRTLHYGAGVFEGIRCYNTERGPAVFRLSDHIERLFDSVHIFSMGKMPFTQEQIVAAVKETIAANGYSECYIRPLVYFSTDEMGLNLDQGKISIGIAVWEWGAYLGEEGLENGIRACVSNFTRHHINAVMTKAKVSGNYPNSMMAKTDALRNGFDEAIMLDTNGYVAECTGENLFTVRGGKLITPPMAPVLEGITRASIIRIARALDIQVVEAAISRDQLYISDEAFVCGTAAEVCAVREIDHRTIGSGKMGPITRKLQRSYQDAIHGRHPL